MRNHIQFFFLLLPSMLLFGAASVFAQGTAFTFQGKLGDNGSPVNGSFDMQFKLFDSADPNSSAQIGTPITLSNPLVQVTNGVFTVQLDFGAGALPGADRFLEIGIRRTNAEPYTLLSPRSKVTSSPYAIRSLNATNANNADGLSSSCIGCVQSSQIQSLDGGKLTGVISGNGSGLTNLNLDNVSSGRLTVGRGGTGLITAGPTGNFLRSIGGNWTTSALRPSDIPGGSGNYIQNSTSPQTANFNVSGNGTVGGALNVGGIGQGQLLNVTGIALVRARINASPTNLRAADANAGLSLTLSGQPGWSLASAGNAGSFQIFNDATGQNALAIDRTTNNVGVGTISPAQKLSVAGTIESTSGGVKFPDGTVQDGAVGPTYTTASNNTLVEFSQTNGAERVMLHLTIPNGAYLMESTLEIQNTNFEFGSNTRSVRCRFAGETSTLYHVDLDADHRSVLTLHSIITVSTGGIDVLCSALPDGRFVAAFTRRMTAIRLGGTISVQ